MRPEALEKLAARLPADPGLHRDQGDLDFVVFVPFVALDGELFLLFEKRARGIRQEQEICFPGGSVEAHLDGSVEDTALRETQEELGVDLTGVSVLGRLDAILTHWGGLIDVVVGRIDAATVRRATPNPDEVERTLLVPVSFLHDTEPARYAIRVEMQPSYRDEEGKEHVLFPTRELGLPERYWRPWAGRPHEVVVYRYDGETIWGLTAALTLRVMELFD